MKTLGRCPTCHRPHKRSVEANAYYWALLHAIAENVKPSGKTFTADVWHQWAKSKFLGCDDFQLPSGKTLTIPRSSASLDVVEFQDYVTRIEAWAAERGVYLADREAA